MVTRCDRQETQSNGGEDLAFALVHATVAKVGTFHVALELLVALDLTLSLTTSTLLVHHLTTLLSITHQTTFTTSGD